MKTKDKRMKIKRKHAANEELAVHVFHFDAHSNGGEDVSLTTKFLANGDPVTKDDGVFLNQEITLQSYGNSASISLYGTTISPEKLRELANQLEVERNKLTA